MAVPINRITTLKQAYEYALAGKAAAASVCPAAANAYNSAANAISVKLAQADMAWFDDETAVADSIRLLRGANEACNRAKPATVPSQTDATVPKPKAPVMPPPSPAGVSAGLPWWAWGLIAAGAVWAIKGTKKKGRGKKKAKKSARRRRRR